MSVIFFFHVSLLSISRRLYGSAIKASRILDNCPEWVFPVLANLVFLYDDAAPFGIGMHHRSSKAMAGFTIWGICGPQKSQSGHTAVLNTAMSSQCGFKGLMLKNDRTQIAPLSIHQQILHILLTSL